MSDEAMKNTGASAMPLVPKTKKDELAIIPHELFRKAIPPMFSVFFPFKWLWWMWTRRLNVFARKWNDKEPMAKLLVDGIMYGEGPRFRPSEQGVYYSDMYAKQVVKYDLATARTTVVYDGEEHFSGLGFLPDGRLLIVAMQSLRVLVLDPKTNHVEPYADLAAVAQYRANDFVVDSQGRAYVGNFGFDYTKVLTACTTTLARIDPDRSVHVAATDLFFPNGSVITPDGKTLIVGETLRGVLTAFDIRPDGSLTNRRVWAYVGTPVDGIALDAEGCVWASVPQVGIYKTRGCLIRVREGGEIVNLLGFGRNGIENSIFACQLGTDAEGKHHLYFFEAITSEEHVVTKMEPARAKQNAVLKSIEVPVGPARMPANPDYCGGYC